MTPQQYGRFERNVIELIRADDQLDVFEWLVHRLLIHTLAPRILGSGQRRKSRGSENRVAAISALLSVLAYAGHRDDEAAVEAFRTGSGPAGMPGLEPASRDAADLERLGSAVDRLNGEPPAIKRRILSACAAVISADREITVDEAELFRAVAAALDCPVPPVLPGQTLV